jgi:hypothetical protein
MCTERDEPGEQDQKNVGIKTLEDGVCSLKHVPETTGEPLKNCCVTNILDGSEDASVWEITEFNNSGQKYILEKLYSVWEEVLAMS